ncbi:MAG TPA: hypothetical protein VLH15_04445 [Dehalococcoidales bacterium]|nr:hypothetical protein [Dehalococcoidales bacterium]
MPELKTAKYVKEAKLRKSNHKEIAGPIPMLTSDIDFGDLGFSTYWEGISQPFVHAPAPHNHDFPQYLIFLGGDVNNLMELGAEIELNLSEDGKNLEKHIITRATTIYIPPGLYHGPLIYRRVDRPFMFIDMYFSAKYSRKS